MRAVRLTIVLLIVSPIFMLALSESRLARQPFAQVTAAPGPVPLTPPAAPGQPQRADCAADATSLPMHLLGARHMDRMVRQRIVVELSSRATIRARAMRQFSTERERTVTVHRDAGNYDQPAEADYLQRHRLHATRPSRNLGGTIRTAPTLEHNAADHRMLAMRLQLR